MFFILGFLINGLYMILSYIHKIKCLIMLARCVFGIIDVKLY